MRLEAVFNSWNAVLAKSVFRHFKEMTTMRARGTLEELTQKCVKSTAKTAFQWVEDSFLLNLFGNYLNAIKNLDDPTSF